MERLSLLELRKKLKNYKHINELVSFIEKVIYEYKPLAVILFGSLSSGEYYIDSDADIIVISLKKRVDLLEEGMKIKCYDELGLVDVLVYGHIQFSNMIENHNLVAIDSIMKGILVFNQELQEWFNIKEKAALMEKSIVPFDGGWKIITV